MSNLHHVIANKRPISHEEKYVLDVYMTLAIIIFARPLSIESIEFIVTLMRLNNIAQRPVINVQMQAAPQNTGMNVAMYHEHISNISRSMMR